MQRGNATDFYFFFPEYSLPMPAASANEAGPAQQPQSLQEGSSKAPSVQGDIHFCGKGDTHRWVEPSHAADDLHERDFPR